MKKKDNSAKQSAKFAMYQFTSWYQIIIYKNKPCNDNTTICVYSRWIIYCDKVQNENYYSNKNIFTDNFITSHFDQLVI